MKAIKCIVTILAVALSATAWGQQNNDQKNAYAGYFECRAIAEYNTHEWTPTQEAIDSTCYLLGVNLGLTLKDNGFFESFEQMNLNEFEEGIKTAISAGEPSVTYGIDHDWASQFKISPYDMSPIFEDFLTARKEGREIPVKNSWDVCYLWGVNYGIMLQSNDFFDSIEHVNMLEFIEGLDAGLLSGAPASTTEEDTEWASNFRISPYQMNRVLNDFLAVRREYKKMLNGFTEDYFLIVNAKREGVKETESGLQYILHSEGEGGKVIPTDHVAVNYTGYFLDGTEFDSSQNAEFVANQVIKGWTEGLGLVGVGGKVTLFIPSHLAYGENGIRLIEPNTLLVFDVEVLSIEHNTLENAE